MSKNDDDNKSWYQAPFLLQSGRLCALTSGIVLCFYAIGELWKFRATEGKESELGMYFALLIKWIGFLIVVAFVIFFFIIAAGKEEERLKKNAGTLLKRVLKKTKK